MKGVSRAECIIIICKQLFNSTVGWTTDSEYIGAITFPAANLDAISRSYKLHVQYSRYDIWIDFIAFLVFVDGGGVVGWARKEVSVIA